MSKDPIGTLRSEMMKAAKRLRQFGRLAAGRMFGTLANTDGRYLAVVDEWERSLFTRAEMNAVARILIDKGIISTAEWTAAVVEEYRHLADAMEKGWPELRVTETGIDVHDLAAHAERSRRERWPA